MRKTLLWAMGVGLLGSALAWAASKTYDGKALDRDRASLPLDSVAPTRPGAFETVPDETGAFVYEATSLRPLIEGAPVVLDTLKPSGLTVARVRSIRQGEANYYKDHEGLYWKLGEIPEGDYGLGLLCDSWQPALYLNGRLVQLTSATDGVRVAPGVRYDELRTTGTVRLRPGDELAVMSRYGGRLARLILRRPAPPPGRHFTRPHYDAHTGGPDTALAVTGQALFYDAGGNVLPTLDARGAGRNQRAAGPGALETAPDGRPAVRCEIFNPLPTAVEVDYAVAVRSYFRLPVGGENGRLRLEPHTAWRKLIPFDALRDERAFSAELTVKVVEPKDEKAWRAALKWPALDWIEFFPGLRQGLPWPESFADYDLRRLEFSEPVHAVRRRVLLDDNRGAWQAAYSPNWQARWPTEEALQWERGVVPVGWSQTERGARAKTPPANALYLRRTFTLPEDAVNESCEIFLDGVSHEAAIYVNGVEAGRVRGGNAPLLADITAVAHPGENELVIVSRNALAIMNPAYINPESPEPNLNYLDAPGHFSKDGMSVGSVELLLSPRVAARELQVIPSTRQKTLAARFEVVNHRDQTLKLKLRARVFDGAEPVFELGERQIDVAPGAVAPLEFSRDWPDARWWWPTDPHLYVMAVETFDAATDERLDQLRARFGFRETWIDGPHMMLNGLPVRPKGSALGYREEPENLARGVEGSGGADWCDERGMMGGTYITQLSNTASRHNVERDEFWRAAESNALRSAMQRVNNPSVARWDMSNEWLKYLDYSDPMAGARRFKNLSDAVRAFDPTRWTTYGAEGDVYGLMDHFDFHYMSPYFGAGRMRGVNPYFPDGEFWRELQEDYPPNAAIPLNSHTPDVILRPDEKMFFDREFLWKVGGLMAPGTTAYLGENAVAWSAWDAASGPALWMWKQKVDGHRDVGVSLINSYTHPGLRRRTMTRQTFIVPEVQHHGFGGRTIERRYAVLQDRFRTCDMTFRWTLRGPDGTRLDGGEDRRQMSSGTTHRGVLRVKLPGVDARTVCVLALELESDRECVMAEERDIAVFPDAPVQAGKLERKVLLFEPGENAEFKVQSEKFKEQSEKIKGQGLTGNVDVADPARDTRYASVSTAAALAAAGVPFERIADFAAPALTHAQTNSPLPLLIIAEDSLNESNRRAVRELRDFVERGGRVLILRQTVLPAGLPAETSLDSHHWASQVYVRAGNHPVVAGWTDWDFHFWANDRAVTAGGYVKPPFGPATVILDSGESAGSQGIEWAGLVEMYRGAGLYLLCQLPVAAKIDQEPMAREVLGRMLAYMGGTQGFRQPVSTLRVMTAPNSAMAERLRAIGAEFELVAPDVALDGASRVLMDAAAVRDAAPARAGEWAAAIEAGARVTVAEAGPQDAAWLGALAGRPVHFSVQPYGEWDGRGLRSAWTPLTAGLSHIEQYWKRFNTAQNAGGQAEDTKLVLEPFQAVAASVEGEGVVEAVWPGALVEVAVGAGRLALDQRNLYTAHPDLTIRADRSVSALVLGMGGRMAATVEYPEMPANVAYQPLDLGPWANRAFLDETPEDGEGGWSDQGSGADLREFPTHNRRLGGVPFVFAEGEKKCIVLRSPNRPFPERLPESVTIPIGKLIAGAYFLHATAYGGRPAGIYEFQYEDGTTESIVLMSGINAGGWVNPASEFPRERGTRTVVAWTGSTPRFARVGVFRMEWVNPYPEKTVTALRYHKPQDSGGVPLLMGLTLALPAGSGGVGQSQEKRDRAVALAAEAAAALAAGDVDTALKQADAALALDDACEDAHAVRGDLADREGVEDKRLRVYQEWIDSGSTRARPYNVVGEIMERRGNLRGALDAYRRSLEIEWNQPPIIEAKSRMEQAVK